MLPHVGLRMEQSTQATLSVECIASFSLCLLRSESVMFVASIMVKIEVSRLFSKPLSTPSQQKSLLSSLRTVSLDMRHRKLHKENQVRYPIDDFASSSALINNLE